MLYGGTGKSKWKQEGKEKACRSLGFYTCDWEAKKLNKYMSTVIFVKLSAATFSAAVALIWLTSSDVWEIGNVNCDAAVSLCQSGHHQCTWSSFSPLWEGIEGTALWWAEKGWDADWGFDWNVSLKSMAIQNRINSLSPHNAICWD